MNSKVMAQTSLQMLGWLTPANHLEASIYLNILLRYQSFTVFFHAKGLLSWDQKN